MKVEMQYELLQPWTTFVMKTQLPPPILEKMLKITDEIIENRAGKGDNPGAGQLIDQFFINFEILEQEEVMGVFLEICRNFVIQAFCQAQPFNKEDILKEEWMPRMTRMWINSQKDNEYFPVHIHTECTISSVMYLKIPEYLPPRKTADRLVDIPNNLVEDGAIVFLNNVSKNNIWGQPNMTIQPQVGDFYIFPATQQHFVYPFRTPDGKGERRSVSLNAAFTSKSEQDALRKQQEDQEAI